MKIGVTVVRFLNGFVGTVGIFEPGKEESRPASMRCLQMEAACSKKRRMCYIIALRVRICLERHEEEQRNLLNLLSVMVLKVPI